MSTEVWYRNPSNYAREMAEVGVHRVAWDAGMLYKRRVDPALHAETFFQGKPWRSLVISPQGSYEVGKGGKIIAAYPTWVMGEDDIQLLEDYAAYPIGEREELLNDKNLPDEGRPRRGQENRVIIMGLNLLPPRGLARDNMLEILNDIQFDNPDCILHLHGSYSYAACFQNRLRAADIDPRAAASKGTITTPVGQNLAFDSPKMQPSWLTMFGQTAKDMEIPRERCIYNIRSAEWAAKSNGAAIQPVQRPTAMPDIETSDDDYIRPRSTLPFLGSAKAMPGDKFFCDECSLNIQCKIYRKGSVCTLPSAETQKLVKLFGTRKSSDILEGMSTLMQMGAERLGQKMEEEQDKQEFSPEVTKMMNTLFDQGAKLAKLTDPSLRGGVNVKVGVVTGATPAAAVGAGNPRQLIAGVMREFEIQGFTRDQITPEMVHEALAAMGEVGPTPIQNQIRGEIVGGQ